MINRAQSGKLLAMAFLLGAAFVGLGYRLVEIQVMEHEKFRRESEGLTRRTFVRAPKRGDIRDVRGHLLAGSVFVRTVFADPSIIRGHGEEVATVIAPVLGMSEAEIVQRLQSRNRVGPDGTNTVSKYVVLKNKVPIEICEMVRAAMQRLPLDARPLTKAEQAEYRELRQSGVSVSTVDDQIRIYPNESLAAHVLGCVTTVEVKGPKGEIQQIRGIEGIEQSLDETLRGVAGWRNTEVAKHRELAAFRDQDVEARQGWNVALSIDSAVQNIVESELAEAMEKHSPLSASGLVVRPRTGEILAMATFPNYNPNHVTGSSLEALQARRNRVITDMHEPGSTFKIVVISGALNDRTVSLEEKIDCENGSFLFAGRRLGDHERFGVLSVEEVIMHSSNIGAAKVGIKMGPDRLYQYVRAFGFGKQTGIPLLGESAGTVHPVSQWTKLSISRIPMGHEVAATPLQMVMAMCAVANDGKLMRPMLVDHLEDEQGQVVFRNYPQQIRQVVSDRAAHDMVTALKSVVSNDGTGKKARLEHYTVAGKTGTAQKLVNGKYRHDKHFSSFIGFFPADDPQLCVAVFLDEPKNGYYGGEAAAPIFHNIAERTAQYLAIKPDVLPVPPAPAPQVPVAPALSGRIAATDLNHL